MQNNNPNDYLLEDEIDLKEIFQLLINSKKLIIVTTLIITLLGAIYSFQKAPVYKSTALIEIGQYDALITAKNKDPLLESTSNLIHNINIVFIHKSDDHKSNDYDYDSLSIKPVEDKLIKIEIHQPSIELGNKTLNEVIIYIENRHSLLLSNLAQKSENQLAYEIERLNNEISYTKSTLLSKNESEKIKISNQIKVIDNQIKYTKSSLLSKNESEKIRISNQIAIINAALPSIDAKIESLNEIVNANKNTVLLLESDPELAIFASVRIIDYENEKINLSREILVLQRQLNLLENNNLESDEIFQLTQEKDTLQIILNLLENNNLESDEIFQLTQEKDTLEIILNILENNVLESDEIFKLTQEKARLESELEFLRKQNRSKTQLIGKIQTIEDGITKEFIIFLSFIIGLFLSITIVLINNSLKAFKED
jgi:hypothetical protein